MVQDNIKSDRRKWPRETIRMTARYFIKDRSSRFQDCTMISISRSGASVILPGYESIREKAPLYLDFIVPKTVQQLSLRGQVRMQESRRGGLVVGIQFDKLLPEHTFYQLIGAEPPKIRKCGANERYWRIPAVAGNFA